MLLPLHLNLQRTKGGAAKEAFKPRKLSNRLEKVIEDLLDQNVTLSYNVAEEIPHDQLTYEYIFKKIVYKAKEKIEERPSSRNNIKLLKELEKLIFEMETSYEQLQALLKKYEQAIKRSVREIADEEAFLLFMVI